MELQDLHVNDRDRINSWLDEARNPNEKNYFKKIIYYWIAFNCYYGARYENPNKNIKSDSKESKYGGEPDKIRKVLSHVRRDELGDGVSRDFINTHNDTINMIINNMSDSFYTEQIDKYNNQFKGKKINYRNACRELIILIEKVRNRLFHGNKTFNTSCQGNKEVLTGCCDILDSLMNNLGFPNRQG